MVSDSGDDRAGDVHTLTKRFITFAGKATLVVFLLDLAAAIVVLAAVYFGYQIY